jgi:hypothetical protein
MLTTFVCQPVRCTTETKRISSVIFPAPNCPGTPPAILGPEGFVRKSFGFFPLTTALCSVIISFSEAAAIRRGGTFSD